MAVKEAVLMAPPMTASKLLINPDQEQRGLTAGVWSISPRELSHTEASSLPGIWTFIF